jgi:ectoine hydroxylase-related dioxygenase (phytanoyl-CoA dioxygenase family)
MTLQSTVRRTALAARRSLRDPRSAVQLVQVRAAQAAASAAAASGPTVRLAPAQALRENGFVVFRSLFTPTQCAALAAEFKAAAGITEGERFTRVDATNRIPSTRKVLFDDKLLGAVRAALDGDARFLQVSDLHYLHDTVGWHRDSVHRERDNSLAADWREDDGRFGVVKAILYLESANAAMGLLPGSHATPIEMDRVRTKVLEARHAHLVVDVEDEPNRRLTAPEKRLPLAWKSMPGDVLVFDQRTYHAGRRVNDGRVSGDRAGAKFTLSLVFGLDNHHSERFYSYFRYARRELSYADPRPELRAGLEQRGLMLGSGMRNYYVQHPEELRLATLRKPETVDELVAEFTRAGHQQ